MKLDTDVMVMSRKGCLDNYDTLFCVGPHMLAECVESENIYHTKVKNKVKYGYTLLDEMRRKYLSEEHNENEKKIILIAPSWRVDNIIDLCLEELLDALRGHGYQIIVRPHPQEVKTKRDYLESVREKYESDDIEFQMDFSSDKSVLDADVLIADWSGIAWEYSFISYKPTLFINTPMKVMNPEWERFTNRPVDITYRDKIGKQIEMDQMDCISEVIDEMIRDKDKYSEALEKLLYETIYNVGNSAEVGARYIISVVQRQIEAKRIGRIDG